MLTPARKKKFVRTVRAYYRKHGRLLPWRETIDPYAIMVSELMLQQTQVDRVLPKYVAFLQQFPTVRALEQSPLKKIMLAWQGLGYNRRAVLLKKAAAIITKQYRGTFPGSVPELEDLPGIGPYSARAIAVFAYNQPHVLIETNIRAVFLHHFFPRKRSVPDQALLPLIEQTLAGREVRTWYWALMDYGSYLKKTVPNPSRRSAHHTRQASFADSDRQLRGRIVAHLTQAPPQTIAQLVQVTAFSAARVRLCVAALIRDEIVETAHRRYQLSDH